MTQLMELYKCKVCENVVEVVHQGVGALVCCDEMMKLIEVNTPSKEDAHYAHIELIDELTKKIYFNHPMTFEHHIEFIEVISLDNKYIKRKYLKPEDKPELVFECHCKEGFMVRNYCNIHGLNKTQSEAQ